MITTPGTFSSSAESALQRAGLPYWILYLLLSVILLLLAFIFLRDKERRQRLSLSLIKPRQRFDLIALQARQAREKKKRAALLQELALTARHNKVKPKKASEVWRKLGDLEGRLQSARSELKKASARMAVLRRKGRGGRRLPPEERAVRTVKIGLRKTLKDIASLERLQKPLLEDLGNIIRDSRAEHEAFVPIHVQLDLVEESIANFPAAIDRLKKA